MITMMPSPAVAASADHSKSKPKLGFSIESLVGRGSPADPDRSCSPSPGSSSPRSSPFRRKSPETFRDVWKPSVLRFSDLGNPLPSCLTSCPSSPITTLSHTSHTAGFGISPAVLPLAAFLPPSQGFPNPIPSALLSQVSAFGTPLPPSSLPREYPYPWLFSRHNRIFGHRFPGPEFPTFLLPFRKPKRIRTAFSPTQLLKLEQAFERNQYVVGAERKQLAQTLNLSETQVKVWFQNRRTKHKRVVQDDDQIPETPQENSASGNSSSEVSNKVISSSTTTSSLEGRQQLKSSKRSSNKKRINNNDLNTCVGTPAVTGEMTTSALQQGDVTALEYDEDDVSADDESEDFCFKESQISPGTSYS